MILLFKIIINKVVISLLINSSVIYLFIFMKKWERIINKSINYVLHRYSLFII